MSRQFVIGVGCRKGCSADAIEGLIYRALTLVSGNDDDLEIAGLFTLIDKQHETGLAEAARRLGLGLNFLSREALRAEGDRVRTHSAQAEAQFGVPSVAEAAALAGAGPGAVLIVARLAANGATCAIAECAR